MPFLKNVLKPGYSCVFRGNVSSKGANLVMEQPKIYSPEEYVMLTQGLHPCYPLTKGLSNQAIQKAVKQALETKIRMMNITLLNL